MGPKQEVKRNEKGYPLLENGEVDWELANIEKAKFRDEHEQMDRNSSVSEGGIGKFKKPHRKHATNYTPPKKKRRKKQC